MSGQLDVGLALPTQEGLSASDYVELARLGDEEGFHTVTVGEIAGADAFTVLGAIASTTSRIRLGSGIIAIYNRSPVLTAMGFASLESLAPGRVFAGLGTGSHRIVEDWNDREFSAPLQTMREYVEIFRAVGRGERIDRAGGAANVRGFQLQHPPPRDVPVFLAGFQRGMLRLAGAIADGVHFALWPPDELPARIADVHDGAVEAGRDPASIEILVSVHSLCRASRSNEHWSGSAGSFSSTRFARRTVRRTSGLSRRSTARPRSGTPATGAKHSRSFRTRRCSICVRSGRRRRWSTVSSRRAAPARRCRSCNPQSLEPGDASAPAATVRAVAEFLRVRPA